MSNHTPGPWEKIEHKAYHTSYIIRGGQAQNQIAQCFNWQDKGFDVNSEANARLISAAPELLEALEAQESAEKWIAENDETDPFFEATYTLMLQYAKTLRKAAIAKATGEKP